MKKELIKKVRKCYKTLYEVEPILVFSPGRINLIGEHTDYNDGFVFPAAINKGIALAIQKSDKNISLVFAMDKDEAHEFYLDQLKPLKDGEWRNYILGVVSEIQKGGYHVGNFNIVFAGNIPSGAGMSSSAALENSIVYGINELFNLGLSKEQMILISQKAEHNFAGVKCGIMDQYTSMFGKRNSALFLDCRTMESIPFTINFKDYTLILINSNVKHDLSDSAYNDRRKVCEKLAKKLNIPALRDASIISLDAIRTMISKGDYEKGTYIVEENERVKLFSKAIMENDLKSLGVLLFKSHKGLSEKYKVSCAELDYLVEMAKGNTNVLGARMMGGGFGGCSINLVLKREVKKFKKEVAKGFKSTFNTTCSFYTVKLSKGTHLVNS
jgi:galactokinase